VLGEEHLDQLLVRPAGAANLRKYVLLLERVLVVVLAELTEELGGVRKSGGIDLACVRM
jgi:hypothetical protein